MILVFIMFPVVCSINDLHNSSDTSSSSSPISKLVSVNMFQFHSFHKIRSNRLYAKNNTPILLNEAQNHSRIEESDTTLEIINCSFTLCNTMGVLFNKGAGGTIFTASSKLTIDDTKFEQNSAVYGGAIACYDSKIHITGCSFYNNKALEYCGALWSMGYVPEDDTTKNEILLTINESIFSNNRANEFYGALSANYTNPVLYNCQFINNSASYTAGAAGICGYGVVYLKNTEFLNNSCDENSNVSIHCPALWLQGPKDGKKSNKVYLDDVTFKGNRINNELGAIIIYQKVDVELIGNVLFDGEEIDMIKKYPQEIEVRQSSYIQEDFEHLQTQANTNGPDDISESRHTPLPNAATKWKLIIIITCAVAVLIIIIIAVTTFLVLRTKKVKISGMENNEEDSVNDDKQNTTMTEDEVSDFLLSESDEISIIQNDSSNEP